MSIRDLKIKVCELAEVETVQQLKVKYQRIKTLDMRHRTSWQQALIVVQAQITEFEAWLKNPPDKYNKLFREIETTSQNYAREIVETRELAQEIILSANELEGLALEVQSEASSLKKAIELNRKVAIDSELN